MLTKLVRETQNREFIEWYAKLELLSMDMCMHGSSRDKRSRLLTTPNLCGSLAMLCDNSHTHAAWTIRKVGFDLAFGTASEAEYPLLFSNRYAQCLLESALSQGLQVSKRRSLAQQFRNSLGDQRKGSVPLTPEFREFVRSEVPVNKPGFREISSPHQRGHNTEREAHVENSDVVAAEPLASEQRLKTMFKYGVQWPPESFLEQAKQICHPRSPAALVPQRLKSAIATVLSSDPMQLSKMRLKAVLHVKKVVEELKDEESALKASLDPTIAKILEDKPSLAFAKLLRDAGHPDMVAVDFLKHGVKLHGAHDLPADREPYWNPATMDAVELLESAEWRRRSLMTESYNNREDTKQEDVHDATMQEMSLGHLQGPCCEQEVSNHFASPQWLLTPRFVLYQGANRKVRAIDDCKRSGLNSSFSSNFLLEVEDVDALAGVVATIGECLMADSLDGLGRTLVQHSMPTPSLHGWAEQWT